VVVGTSYAQYMNDQILSQHKHQLYAICKEFIDTNNIACAETIYQTDRVIENTYEFIERICEIVGYKE